ncbi:FAD binding domain-containing protein [Herbaspirillum sp. GCM10030257]|uniref:FAD binding domain-containing protein n=1 Tax=Herbaspirillum sp. GCM10030257 TaxID=3273393 RepID=UPI00361258B7
MYAFSYFRPASIEEAVAFLKEHEGAKPLSGGMTLVPTLKQRLASPSHLVDLTWIPEMKGIAVDGSILRVGAATRHAEVAASEIVAAAIPALSRLAGLIADPQVRNRGTIGGSVANNDPAADYPAGVLGLNGTVVTNERRIPADEFFVGMFETVLRETELVTAIEFNRPDAANYLKYAHAASGYAVAGVFVARFGGEARVAVTGAGSSVFRWTEAEEALGHDFNPASLQGVELDDSILLDDIHAPAVYRANLVKVYARRAVEEMTNGN